METEDKQKVHSVWVDRENRVISFREVPDFEELQYPTYEEMLAFVIDRGFAGYAIQ